MSRKWKWRVYSIILFLLTLPYLFLNINLLIKSADHHNKLVPQLIKEFDPQLDLLAFFHIQKTSGTNFGWQLVRNLEIKDNSTTEGWKKACYTTFDAVYDTHIQKYRKQIKTKCQRINATDQSWLLTWQEDTFGWKCGLVSNIKL